MRWYALLVLLMAAPLNAQGTVHYDVAFPNAVHHEARITATFTGVPAGPLELRMSRSSPGRYALHEFAKNVYDVTAVDAQDSALAVTHPDPYGWAVPRHGGTVTVRYTLYADHADGTYSGIDLTHARLQMPCTFIWARGWDARPITVTFHPLQEWKVATQLPPVPGRSETYSAPGLQYFMDSPAELSDWSGRQWTITNADGRTETIRIAMHFLGTPQQLDEYTAMVKKVVDQEAAVFGEWPHYDYGSYTFIAGYLPYVFGDGMEHRNSTSLTSSRSLADNLVGAVHTLAHEYFHSWNMERIRAREIEPFDFERANMSPELWFGEGFTNYYDGLMVKRAGITSIDDFAREEGGALNAVLTLPGRRYHSPAGMSELAPFVDAATSIDRTNFANTFISYYTWGEALGVGLDLTLRERYHLTLDDYMRAMWRRFGRTEVPYAMTDLQATLADVTHDARFAADFFANYVHGRQVLDYDSLVRPAGLLLRRARPGAAFLGYVRLEYSDSGAAVVSNALVGQPIYQAGIDDGDRIISIDGTPLNDDTAVRTVLARHRPGDTVQVELVQRERRRSVQLVLQEDPTLELVTYEAAGLPVTDAIRRFRESWLGPQPVP
jgi:predicted metalloprotease with PDZ domain